MIEGHTLDVLIEIVARDVAVGVEMAKKLGFKTPERYAIGLRVFYDWNIATSFGVQTRFRIRFDDVSYDCIAIVPYMDGRVPMGTMAKMWEVVTERVREHSAMMIHVWLDRHPDASQDKARLEEALKVLHGMSLNDAFSKQLSDECAKSAQRLQYKRVR